ncbi:Z1 domain-containing protein [Cellulosimicrobium sp. E-16]|uniref:Z1 domain-containing protein n=1 Tax=Cellulosimicrobium sp. E-16 TaxID=3404049 RepID=UPI003CEED33D
MSGRTERVYFEAPSTSTDSWWERYAGELTGLTLTGRDALRVDCAYILDRGVFGSGQPGTEPRQVSRTRTGLVMGSVQSGKTASMLGVTAMALDRGVDIVIILAGTRLSLWRQTYERLSEQLDVGLDSAAKSTRRVLCPSPGAALSGADVSLQETYRVASAQVRRKLAQGRPLIVVAMKQTNHLYALGSALRSSVFDAVAALDRPVHMLVLDDEADDGSVLDAVVEAGLDPLSPNLKQIPRAIADLWEPRAGGAPTNLYSTYVGYTATPQANLLQEDHNPLAPRDFVISLRTPLDVGHPIDTAHMDAPRSSTFPERNGLDDFYTGGEVFYKRGLAAGLCVELTGRADDDLGEAIRAYLVAGAIRLHWAGAVLGPRALSGATFDSRDAVLVASPPPHSMLFHPAAAIGRHFEGAEDVLLWCGVADRRAARDLIESGDARLPESLAARMRGEETLWEAWIDRYRHASDELARQFNVLNPRSVPDWSVVRALLESEIIPGTRVSVVNSDPNADDRPEYKPSFDEATQQWRAARDLSTIFVSGNVMARGLTLEGLTTALFQRGSNSPFADTQMQMQRWFGYRGKHIELCRLFAARDQIELFTAYHDIDEALREGIAEAMAERAPSPAVLHGMSFLATGKIASLGRTPLCPSSRPFVTLINDGRASDPNVEVLAKRFAERPSSDVVVGRSIRGRALTHALSLMEAADLLDDLRYDSYRPGSNHRLGELWSQVQARVGASVPLPSGVRFYNAPEPPAGRDASPVRLDCPYAIAAYLRLWAACLTRPVRGLFVTGAPSDLWSMVDLHERQTHQPMFTVGIRYGKGTPVSSGALTRVGFDVRTTEKALDGPDLATRWGANDPTAGPLDYRGDEFFDYYHRGERVPLLTSSAPWRPAGSHGQILFYVNQLPEQRHPSVALGVCIPAGGPEQFAATRAGSPAAA